MLHSHGQRDRSDGAPAGDGGPVDVLIRALCGHDPATAQLALAPAVRLSVPSMRIHVVGRGEVAAALAAVIDAFADVDYRIRSRYLNVQRVTDEAVLLGVHARPLLGAAPSHRHVQVPLRLIATHDGTSVTTLDFWPDVAALRTICDELSGYLDQLTGATGEMVSALRASMPHPSARVVLGREHEPVAEPAPAAPLAPTRSPSRTEGLRAPITSRTRRRRGIIAGVAMAAATAATVTGVIYGVLHNSATEVPIKSYPSLTAKASVTPTPTTAAAVTPTPTVAPTASRPLVINRHNEAQLNNDIAFGVDKATLTPSALEGLKGLINRIKQEHRRGTITVVGYTDAQGSADHNLKLSNQRAEAVAVVLQAGLPDNKVDFKGLGESTLKPADRVPENNAAWRIVKIQVPKAQAA